jgi:hypothetical protein
LAIHVSQHGYITFTEKAYSKGVQSSITVCPLVLAIFTTQKRTCAASTQYLNLAVSSEHFLDTKMAGAVQGDLLFNAGVLFNASTCHVSKQDYHIYPTIRRSMQTELENPHIFLPDKVPIISEHESYQLQELTVPTL